MRCQVQVTRQAIIRPLQTCESQRGKRHDNFGAYELPKTAHPSFVAAGTVAEEEQVDVGLIPNFRNRSLLGLSLGPSTTTELTALASVVKATCR